MNDEIGNKKKEAERTMDEHSTESNIERNRGFDFEGEYRTEFTKALYFEKVASTSMEFLKNIMPLQEILDNVKMLGDKTTSDVKTQLNTFVQDYLNMWHDALQKGKTIPGDLLQRAATLARKDRERVEK